MESPSNPKALMSMNHYPPKENSSPLKRVVFQKGKDWVFQHFPGAVQLQPFKTWIEGFSVTIIPLLLGTLSWLVGIVSAPFFNSCISISLKVHVFQIHHLHSLPSNFSSKISSASLQPSSKTENNTRKVRCQGSNVQFCQSAKPTKRPKFS